MFEKFYNLVKFLLLEICSSFSFPIRIVGITGNCLSLLFFCVLLKCILLFKTPFQISVVANSFDLFIGLIKKNN